MVLGPGFNLGDATGRIILDASGVAEGVREAQNIFRGGIDAISGMVGDLGQQMTTIGTSLTVLTSPILLGFQQGVGAAVEFDSAMKEISARTGLVGADLQQIGDFALKMGADTVFSGQQAADAFLQLLSSGQSAEQAIATLPAVLDLAAASGDDLGRTADVVTDIMAAFNLQVDDAAMVADALARAAASSSADVSSLGQGFAGVGGVARQFGLDIDQTAAVLAIFAERGIKGAEAGTQLKSMLLNMNRDTPEVRAAWAELGTSMFDTEGNMRDLGVVMEEIRVAMQDMSPEEQIRLMTDLGGSYGFLGLQALTAGMSIEEMQEIMGEQADAATIAQIQMASLANTFGSFIGSLEAAAITVLLPFLNDVMKPMIEEGIRLVNMFTDWAKENPELAATIVKVAAVAAILGPVLVIVGAAMQALAPIIALAGAVIGLILSPIGLLLIGVALLAAAWATNWNGIRDKTNEVVDAIKAKIAEISPDLDALKTNIETAVNNVETPDFSGLGTAIQTGLNTAITNAQDVQIDTSGIATWADENANVILNTVVGVVGIVLGGPIGATIGAAKLIATAIETDFLGFGTFIEQSGIGAAVQSGVDALRGVIEGAFESLFGGGGGAGPGTALAEEFASGMAVQAGPTAGGPLMQTIRGLIDGLLSGIELFTPEIQESIQQIGNGISGFIEALGTADTSGLEVIAAGMLQFFADVGAVMSGLLLIGLDIVTDIFENVFPKIGEGIAAFINLIAAVTSGDPGAMLQAIADGLSAFIGAIAGAVAGFADPLIQAINGLTGSQLPSLTQVFGDVATAIKNIWDAVVEVVQPAIDEFQRLVDWFLDGDIGLQKVVTFVNETFILAVATLQSVLSGIWDAVKGPLENLKNGLQTIFDWIKTNVLDPFAKAISDIANALGALGGNGGSSGGSYGGSAAAGGLAGYGSHDYPGPAYAGVPYKIGTQEVFMPKDDGYITPLGGASVGNTYQISVQMPEAALADPARARMIGQDFAQAILDEMDST